MNNFYHFVRDVVWTICLPIIFNFLIMFVSIESSIFVLFFLLGLYSFRLLFIFGKK